MQNLVDALCRNAAVSGSKIAFSDDDQKISFEQLLARAAGLAEKLGPEVRVIGVLAESGVNWAIAQLAAVLGGKCFVPIPTFFSSSQVRHLVRDAEIELVLVTEQQVARLGGSGIKVIVMGREGPVSSVGGGTSGFGQIIYTSGSTGAPKGVRHDRGQIEWSAKALASATGANGKDLHLSVLPLPLLLETVCAIFVPILVGARVHFETGLSERLAQGNASGIAEIFDAHQPTTCVLVPQMLRQWCGELHAGGRRAPRSLRFVAVGGASLGAASAKAASDFGIPVYEGYGLSECCSVVAVNTPAARRPGTVGQVLPGLVVQIDHGEIVVEGPTVMDGYLHKPRHLGPWRTGDLGSLSDDGYLSVLGRKDNLIVTSTGRNVTPEWVESILAGEPRILTSCVFSTDSPFPGVLIIPSSLGAAWLDQSDPAIVEREISDICAALPDYAIPKTCAVVSFEDAKSQGLFTSNGRIKRDLARSIATRSSGA